METVTDRWGSIFTLLLSACAAPTQPAQPPEAEPPLGNSQFAIRNLQEELEARTDDRRIVAELLGVPGMMAERG